MNFRLKFLLLVTSILYMQPAAAVKIVRLQLEYGGAGVATGGFAFAKVTPTLDLELFDGVTPNTVTNYLNYVNSGRYDLTFVNRSLPGFVLQAGGVTNIDPLNNPLGPATFGVVAADPSIANEPGLSNIRGTIAMAKVPAQFVEGGSCVAVGPGCTLVAGTGPDSATSEWFINLDNNSDFLDTDNGGFTVFGSIIDDGMDIADEIASFPISDLSFLFGSSYNDLPFADYDFKGSATAYQRNLIMIMTATEISRPIMRFKSTGAVFDSGPSGSDISMDVIVTNTGNETLNVNTIDPVVPGAPFVIQSENCSNTSLAPVSVNAKASCTISLLFTPAALCQSDDQLVINYTSQVTTDKYTVTYRTFAGFDDSDSDEILGIIEQAAPNLGDGNNDGIKDDIQSNVASFALCQGNYVTLVAEDAQVAKSLNLQSDTAFKKVQLLDTIPADSPLTSFDYGNYHFDINLPNNGITGDSVRMALYFPADVLPSAYYRYGPTPDNTTPHWYDFSFDETTQTGASFIGNITIPSTSGNTIARNMVIINFIDGEKGDDDLLANGVIAHGAGGADAKQTSAGSSGSAVYLWLFSLLLMCRRCFRKTSTRHYKLLSS